MSGVGDDAFSNFERFRNRVETEEADAHQEIVGSDSSLDTEFTKLVRKHVVDAELDELKKKMGKSDA